MPSRTIRDLLLARLGVPTTPQTNRSTASVGTTAGQILRNDTGRVAFLIVNLGAFSIFAVPQVAGQPSPTLGVLIQANGDYRQAAVLANLHPNSMHRLINQFDLTHLLKNRRSGEAGKGAS